MSRRDDEPSVPNDFRMHSCDATGHVLLWACGPLGSFVVMDEAELLYPELLQNHSALFQFKIFHTKSHFPPRYFSLHTRTIQLCPTVVFSHHTACMWQVNIFPNSDVTLSTVLYFYFGGRSTVCHAAVWDCMWAPCISDSTVSWIPDFFITNFLDMLLLSLFFY